MTAFTMKPRIDNELSLSTKEERPSQLFQLGSKDLMHINKRNAKFLKSEFTIETKKHSVENLEQIR